MKTKLLLSLPILAAMTMAGNAQWSDGFESYPLGSIQGLGGWAAWSGAPVSYAGTVVNTMAASGSQSLQIVRGNDTVQTFTGYNSGLWSLSMQQFIPANTSGNTFVIVLNSYPLNMDWAGQMLFNMTAGTVSLAEVTGPTLPLVKNAWVDVRYDFDLGAKTLKAYYNNTLLTTHTWDGLGSLQALDLYADEDTGAGTAQNGPVFYDNVRLTAVPEPGTMALLALGALGFVLRRRS